MSRSIVTWVRRRHRRPDSNFSEQAVALAWGAWAELGVSGWAATHRDWAVDPEPLILFTAFFGDRDPRLRDEATDWCIRNWRYVAKTRLKNLVSEQPPIFQEGFGPFAATVGDHAGIEWPAATIPRRYTATQRSALPELDRTSLVWLRLRAMFGLSARAEILRYFLALGGVRSSVATIATATGYTKRNVAEECATLESAGVLAVRRIGNRFEYFLARREELVAFVGAMPRIRPDWRAMFNIARELVLLEDHIEMSTPRTHAVKVRNTLDLIEGDLDELAVDRFPQNIVAENLWPTLRQLGNEMLGAWSIGRWHCDSSNLKVVEYKERRIGNP